MNEQSVETPVAAPAELAAPVKESARITSIDTLRGFALLGILVMNIRIFAHIFAAYYNPTAIEGVYDGANYGLWYGAEIFYNLKMMSIFSMLFGAGIFLMTSREEARSGRSAKLHYTRMFWLFLIALVHAYLIWAGDILFHYALCGMLIWPLRKLSAKWLISIGAILITLGSLLTIAGGMWIKTSQEQIDAFYAQYPEAREVSTDPDASDATEGANEDTSEDDPVVLPQPTDPADPVDDDAPIDPTTDPPPPPDPSGDDDTAGDETGDEAGDDAEGDTPQLSEQLQAAEIQIEGMRIMWAPPPEEIEKELAAYRGGLMDSIPFRAKTLWAFQIFGFLFFVLWRAGGLMLLGMGLFKLGVFSAKSSKTTYLLMLVIGWIVGIPLIMYGIQQNELHGWTMEYSQTLGTQYNYWGSLGVALGWVAIIMLWCQAGIMKWLLSSLSAVGRMALTNYLMHSIVCTLFFYGHGLGYFGTFELWQQYLVVLAVWIVQLILSPIWLSMFRFGPAEWLWRSLTYMRAQPMRR